MRKFDEYIKEGIVRNVSSNIERARGLRKEAERKFVALNEKVEKLGMIMLMTMLNIAMIS